MDLETYSAMVSAEVRPKLKNLPVTPRVADSVVPAPWMVAFRWEAPEHGLTDRHFGVGAFITPRHVLTSAHLFQTNIPQPPPEWAGRPPRDEWQTFARVGVTRIDTGDRREIVGVEIGEFKMATTMGEAPPARLQDIAVITLDRPAEGAPFIRLATTNLEPGEHIGILGYPDGEEGHGNLTQVDTVVTEPGVCFTAAIGEDESCAANALDNTLRRGFSGGPVIRIDADGEPELVAVCSRGAGFLDPDIPIPVVLANVAGHRDLIDGAIGAPVD